MMFGMMIGAKRHSPLTGKGFGRWVDKGRSREHKKASEMLQRLFRAPSGARTLDPNIKSVVLYQLS